MQSRSATLTGLAFCTVVCLLAAAPPDGLRSNRTGAVPVDSQPRDSQSLSSLAIYDPNPNHLWNRLFRQFYVRKAWDGRDYGGDVLDPLLWGETHYLITGASHQQALSVLDEFLSSQGERLITDPLKRAMLQRDLWAVFDWATDPLYEEAKHNRTELARKLGLAIKRLALSPEQIQALPDTYSLAVAAKAFPNEYDHNQRETAFLPPNLLQPGSGRVNLGTAGEGFPLASGAPVHTQEFGARSLFLVFIRLPGGRDGTLAYIKQLADFPKPCIQAPELPSGQPYFLTRDPITGGGTGTGGMVPNPDLPQFPRGTQVLLLRRMMVIDREGQLRPTRLVESVQIQVFVDIPSRAEWLAAPSKLLQDVFEFRLSRRKLFAGDAGGLRAVARDEWEFRTFGVRPFDQLEGGPGANASMGTLSDAEHRPPRILNTCAGCHGAPGVQSLAATRRLFGQGTCSALKFYATSAEEQAEETIDWKHGQYNWGLLQGLWLSNAD